MGIIQQELTTFKNSIESELSGMESTLTSLQDKIQVCLNNSRTAQDSFSSAYSSNNKELVMNKFTSIDSLFNKLNSSVLSDLSDIISESKTVVNLVKDLENINKKIEEQQSIINSSDDSTIINDARGIISSKENEFNMKQNEALTKLNALKSKDGDLQFVKDFTSSDYLSKIDELNGGTFEKRQYKASNGRVIDYYIWVPNYDSDVEGLPIHVYMHGSGETYTGTTSLGLPHMIEKGDITPSGIVICPQANQANDYYQVDYQEAVIELTDKVADEYKGDKNKISLSGHSMGAMVEYRMIDRHPGYFSAFIPISGEGPVGEGLQEIRTWAFHGAEDVNIPITGTESIIRKLQKSGADATLHVYSSMGHKGVQTTTFSQEFETPDGDVMNPLEWAFLQTSKG